MKSYEYDSETGKLVIYSLCRKTDWPLLEAEGVDDTMMRVIKTAIREAEEIAFRAGQDQVREMMENALSDIGRRVWVERRGETCRQKLDEAPQNRRKRKSSTFR